MAFSVTFVGVNLTFYLNGRPCRICYMYGRTPCIRYSLSGAMCTSHGRVSQHFDSSSHSSWARWQSFPGPVVTLMPLLSPWTPQTTWLSPCWVVGWAPRVWYQGQPVQWWGRLRRFLWCNLPQVHCFLYWQSTPPLFLWRPFLRSFPTVGWLFLPPWPWWPWGNPPIATQSTASLDLSLLLRLWVSLQLRPSINLDPCGWEGPLVGEQQKAHRSLGYLVPAAIDRALSFIHATWRWALIGLLPSLLLQLTGRWVLVYNWSRKR